MMQWLLVRLRGRCNSKADAGNWGTEQCVKWVGHTGEHKGKIRTPQGLLQLRAAWNEGEKRAHTVDEAGII